MNGFINLYPSVLGAYRSGLAAAEAVQPDVAFQLRPNIADILDRYGSKPAGVMYHKTIRWPVERSDRRISAILTTAFRLGLAMTLWRSLVRESRREFYRTRGAWSDYHDYIIADIRQTLGANVDETKIELLMSDILRRMKVVLEFGEAMIRELCSAVAPGSDPDVFIETALNAPTEIVEMLVAAYMQEFIANSALRDRQRLWRPTANAAEMRVFLVHGRRHDLRDAVANILRSGGYSPVILQRELNFGRTIIEKLEVASNCFYAIIILSPDDYGALNAPDAALPRVHESRARQNVIFELGWFMALLGRDRVCCVLSDDLVLPSDVGGLTYYRAHEMASILREIRLAAEQPV